MSDDGPVQLRVKAKYLVSRKYGYKAAGSGHSGSGSHRRKNGAKQEHDHRVPVLIDGKHTRWMRYSEWQRRQADAVGE